MADETTETRGAEWASIPPGWDALVEALEARGVAFPEDDERQHAWDPEKHPRHGSGSEQGGEFAPSGDGGGGTATATADHEHALLDRLRAPDGGFTYSPATESEPTRGYAVSPYPARSKVLTADAVTEDALVEYVVTNWDALSQPDHYLGAWHDPATGKVYLDVSVVKADEREAHALALAKDQIAYFDLEQMKSVDVNRAAKSGQS